MHGLPKRGKSHFNLLTATRCHVIVTARAKEKYGVSWDGEPVARGIVPDVECNLACAVDLIVELGVEELLKGKQPSPDDHTALVVGSRSGLMCYEGYHRRTPGYSEYVALAFCDDCGYELAF